MLLGRQACGDPSRRPAKEPLSIKLCTGTAMLLRCSPTDDKRIRLEGEGGPQKCAAETHKLTNYKRGGGVGRGGRGGWAERAGRARRDGRADECAPKNKTPYSHVGEKEFSQRETSSGRGALLIHIQSLRGSCTRSHFELGAIDSFLSHPQKYTTLSFLLRNTNSLPSCLIIRI